MIMNVSFESKLLRHWLARAWAWLQLMRSSMLVLQWLSRMLTRMRFARQRKLVVAGRKAIAVRCNVADEKEVDPMVQQTVAAFGLLNTAFNNAGVMRSSSMAVTPPGENYL
jgi:NAD(P)-dependent dehydrogenase (short-subunit alcohol dehydrogenase family)